MANARRPEGDEQLVPSVRSTVSKRWSHLKMLGDASTGRDNNFNLIRMVAASSVLLSHSWPLALGAGTSEPQLIGFSLGTLAVVIFFVVSGFFITQSFDTKHSVLAFVVARVLRIYPALTFMLVATVLLLGSLTTVSSLPDYFTDPATFAYVPRNLALFRLQYDLPGVFVHNPYGPPVNGSLWTLFYEVLCYAGVVALGLVGLLDRKKFPVFLLVFATMQCVAALDPPQSAPLRHITLLSFAFVVGASCYIYRHAIPLHGGIVVLLAALAAILWGGPLQRPIVIIALAYACFWLGHLNWWGRNAYNRLGDYSYGMYIYAFPIQQLVVALSPGISPLALAGLSVWPTLLLAVLSWNFVERPALERRKEVTMWLTSIRKMSRLRI